MASTNDITSRRGQIMLGLEMAAHALASSAKLATESGSQGCALIVNAFKETLKALEAVRSRIEDKEK